MATTDPGHHGGSHRSKSQIKDAAVQIAIYVAMYLAVWVILRVMTAPGPADAVAPDTSMAPPVAATASTSPASVDESPPD